jgi:hypothetical protein
MLHVLLAHHLFGFQGDAQCVLSVSSRLSDTFAALGVHPLDSLFQSGFNSAEERIVYEFSLTVGD